MAGEPELRTGSGGEWVLYLQQTLNHHYQQQVIAESGEFDAALEGAVRHFQLQQGLEPSGVADTATWHALTGDPAACYRWPDEPVATGTVAVSDVVVELALTLTGEVTTSAGVEDLLADLTVDGLATDPPTLACTDSTFLPGTASLVDAVRVEYAGTCAFGGMADASGYLLSVAVLPETPAGSTAEWLTRHADPLAAAGTVALVPTAGLVEVG